MTTTYEPLCGDRIENACLEATKIATETRYPVEFQFNGIKLTALPDGDAAALRDEYWLKSHKAVKDYKASQKGQEAARKRDKEVAEKQERLDGDEETLYQVIATCSESDLMDWLYSFAQDDIAVKVNYPKIIELLTSGGYQANQHVGQPVEFFKDKSHMAQWIIGQAMDCMSKGMPPHPICLKFIEDYRKL